MSNTSVVICTYHRTFEGDGNKNIIDYKNQNFDNFSVLFDDHYNTREEEVSANYDGARICLYSDLDFEMHNFNKEISRFHFWGSHQNPKYFYAHFRMLTYFIKNPIYDNYWFFDDDVMFKGDLKGLLNAYEEIDSDFLGIQVFKKEDYEEFPNVSKLNDRMKGSGGHWLGHCPGHGDNFESVEKHMGSFFPIVRFSKQAMLYLLKVHQDGYYGYSEGFVPTTLASAGYKVTSMLDEFNKFLIDFEDCELYHKGAKFTWEWL